MKAPFLGTNNGRFIVRAAEHGLPARLDRGAPGAVIEAYNGPVGLTLHHKSAAKPFAGLPEKGDPAYGPVVTKPVEPEDDRVLCKVPGKDYPQSRNANERTFHWAGDYAASMVKGAVGRRVLKLDGKGKQIRRRLKEVAKLNWQSGLLPARNGGSQ